eukprot:72697-Amphidinium_carterae.1
MTTSREETQSQTLHDFTVTVVLSSHLSTMHAVGMQQFIFQPKFQCQVAKPLSNKLWKCGVHSSCSSIILVTTITCTCFHPSQSLSD